MIKRLQGHFGLVVAAVLVLGLMPGLANAQAIIKVNDNTNFRLGLLLQGWADWTQDATTGGYAQNLYLRRIRFMVGGQIAKDVTFFFETDNPNLGKAPKSLGTGFITQDAFVEWKIANEFRLDGGLILIPFCRNCISSAASLLSLDYGTWSFLNSAPTQSSVGRDTGFQAKGYLAGDHLEYRAGVFQGYRDAAVGTVAGSRNPFRFAGRLQYNVFDVETAPFYTSTYLGKKKILAFGVGLDEQANGSGTDPKSYKAFAADVLLDLPVGKTDAFTYIMDYINWDGGTTFPSTIAGGSTTALRMQNDWLFELGYYLGGAKVQPFFRHEQQRFGDNAFRSGNQKKYQGGLNWYIYGQNLKLTGAFTRTLPENPASPATSQFTVQLQAFYY